MSTETTPTISVSGKPTDSSNATILAVWDAFAAVQGFKPSTCKVYRRRIVHFLGWLAAQGIELPQVTPTVLGSYLDSHSTCAHERMLCQTPLRRLFDLLAARRIIPSNPARPGWGADGSQPSKELPAAEPEEPPVTLDELKAAVRDLDPAAIDDNPEMLDAGLVLLAGLQLGTKKIMPICRFTGVQRRRVAEFAQRLRANGVWTPDGNTALSSTFEEHWNIELIMLILVALGMVEMRPADDGTEPRLYPAEPMCLEKPQ